MMARIYISVGSNISPEKNVRNALSALGKKFGALVVSPVYRSPSQGFDGPDFLNLAVSVETDLTPHQVVSALDGIEDAQGRDRTGPKFSDRTIDLDLLVYGKEVVSDDEMEIPRPEVEEYAHVLVPLVDLAAQERHPLSGRTYLAMRDEMQSRDPGQFTALEEVVFQF